MLQIESTSLGGKKMGRGCFETSRVSNDKDGDLTSPFGKIFHLTTIDSRRKNGDVTIVTTRYNV